MNDRIKRLYEMFLRVIVFMTANAADFQTVPFIAATVTTLQTETDALANLGAEKVTTTAASKDSFVFKGDARTSLRDYLKYIAGIWRTVFDEVEGGENKFRLPPGNSDQTLIAAGKSFAAEAVGNEQIFFDHGVAADFIAQMQSKTTAFEQTINTADTAHGERVGTNAAFTEPAQRGKKMVDKLAPAVKHQYRNNPQKLAAWLVASHVERPSKTAKKDTPPTG
ncbi:MAG: hypothetical protein M3T96_08335 [Acidobacteriota bacterium]|nr:hypothetical protein [Acidobacteriota bacterium]